MRIKFIMCLILLFLVTNGCSYLESTEEYTIIGNYEKESIDIHLADKKDALEADLINIYSSSETKGTIIYQYPQCGKEVTNEDVLMLYVSSGRPPEGLDVEGLTIGEAQKRLEAQRVSYSMVYSYNTYVDNDIVLGLEPKDGGYVLHVSKGRPVLNISGQSGYAVKAGGYIFHTDNEYIWRMNPDGTENKILVDIRNIRGIIPYEAKQLIIYNTVDNCDLYSFNYETNNDILLATDVISVVSIIDDQLIYFARDGGSMSIC